MGHTRIGNMDNMYNSTSPQGRSVAKAKASGRSNNGQTHFREKGGGVKKAGRGHPKQKSLSQSRFNKNQRPVDPFDSRMKSRFAQAYSSRSLHCELVHGSVKHTLKWTKDLSTLDYDPLLVLFCEGLRETQHPYTFVARTGVKDLLQDPLGEVKTLPLLPTLALALRNGLNEDSCDVFNACCESLCQLSACVGPQMNEHLLAVLVPLKKRMFIKRNTAMVVNALHTLAENGGEEAVMIIKSKIPTFEA